MGALYSASHAYGRPVCRQVIKPFDLCYKRNGATQVKNTCAIHIEPLSTLLSVSLTAACISPNTRMASEMFLT